MKMCFLFYKFSFQRLKCDSGNRKMRSTWKVSKNETTRTDNSNTKNTLMILYEIEPKKSRQEELILKKKNKFFKLRKEDSGHEKEKREGKSLFCDKL